MNQYSPLLERQKEYFSTGETRSYAFRKEMLDRLYRALKDNESSILGALGKDLGKSDFEGYATELGIVYEEIRYMKKHLRSFMRKKRAHSPITQFPSRCYRISEPLGSVLIMSPWNYPVQLTLVPLIGAIAGGNTAIVKPSRYSVASSGILARILSDAFDSRYIAAIEGGHEVNSALLELRFDMIFFTGSPNVGRIVMESASKTLTPVVLELGGKSPAIIDGTADIRLAATRLAWGKFLNCGQTCVAPDYVLIKRGLEDEFVKRMKESISRMFTSDPLSSPEFGKIINEKHFRRLMGLLEGETPAIGGKNDPDALRIEPTVLCPSSFDAPAMQEEIFGPILPVIPYDDIRDAMDEIRKREKPLALYIFSSDRKAIRMLSENLSYGGGCINDAVVHLATPTLPFGGVGASGMGQYHGQKSYEAFTHSKSILSKSRLIDLPIRYAPYGKKIKLLRMMMK